MIPHHHSYRLCLPMVGLLIASCCTATAYAQTAWSQFQGNAAHTGFFAEDTVYSSLQKGWTSPIFPTNSVSDLAVNQQGVFTTVRIGYEVIYNDRYMRYNLMALDRQNGSPLWETPVHSYSFEVTAPSLNNGSVYVDNMGHSGTSGANPMQRPHVMAFNSINGASQFSTDFAGQWSAGSRPTLLGNQLISLGGYYGGMDSYNSVSGNRQWFTRLPQQYGYTPAMDDNNVYIYYGAAGGSPGPSRGTLYVIDRVTGKIEYQIQNQKDRTSSSPVVSSVVLGSKQNALVIHHTNINSPHLLTSFNLEDQTIGWSHTVNAINSMAVGAGMVVVPESLSLDAIDELTGTDLWKWNAPANQTLASNVVLTNTVAFVASNDTLYGIDRLTGETAYTQALDYSVTHKLAYYDGAIYSAGNDRVLQFLAAPSVLVPEPSAVLLCGIGLFTMAGIASRRGKPQE